MSAERTALAAPPLPPVAGRAPVRARLRVGVDVGGTFTKAVALDSQSLELTAHASVPTTHASAEGVTEGVVRALEALVVELGARGRDQVELVAFSTTQAMNALLEGDVATVGVVGIGAAPDVRKARRRTRVGDIELAPGRALRTAHAFLDVTHGLDDAAIDAVIGELVQQGAGAFAVSGAFSVDAPEHELRVARRAARVGLPTCAGHELTGAYGLETRTVSAAINAAILPVVRRTAERVERGLEAAGVNAPLLVLRGDGGAMSAQALASRPSFTVGSGPAAGVAAALHRARLSDAIVIECGGTSTNVSVVKRGRPVLRTIKVMGRPTAIRSIDSWVVGAAGGSMPLVGRRGLSDVGPRSAHLAGLGYACFAEADAEPRLELVAPRAGDPPRYAAALLGGERRALTVTCAANALGLVPADSHAHGSRTTALAAFDGLAAPLRKRDGGEAARAVLDAALRKLEIAVGEAVAAHDLGSDVPLVALGGAADTLVPELARRNGRPVVRPDHREVLSSIGAATSLVRVELARAPARTDRRNGRFGTARKRLVHDAERACVDAGAAPGSIGVEAAYDAEEGVIRAVATGAVALESGAALRERPDRSARGALAARALGVAAPDVEQAAETEFYSVYCANGGRHAVAVVDALGSLPVVERHGRVVVGAGEGFVEAVAAALDELSLNLGIAEVVPRVTLLSGARLVDLSDARRREEILEMARETAGAEDANVTAILAR